MSTKIEWTERTWNPVTGCTKVSRGCLRCYAEAMARRLKAMGQPKYAGGFEVTIHPETLRGPERWSRPAVVFVNSMGDLFHEQVPTAFIGQVFATMASLPRHTFQVLTKRAERLAEVANDLQWPTNVWMGVTVEDQECARRIDHLRVVPAAVRFLSVEPLLGPLELGDLDGIDWVIVGGESGPGARPMQVAWARRIRDLCLERSVPFFFKQWGGPRKGRAGRLLDGRLWDQVPTRRAAVA